MVTLSCVAFPLSMICRCINRRLARPSQAFMQHLPSTLFVKDFARTYTANKIMATRNTRNQTAPVADMQKKDTAANDEEKQVTVANDNQKPADKQKQEDDKKNQDYSKLTTTDWATRSLKELGYGFNSAGQLRKLDKNGEPGDKPFKYEIDDNQQICQQHYEALGDAVTHYIYHLLETQEHLQRLPVPVDAVGNGTFIFASSGYDKRDVLMLLIHGSGAVRAGQWARSLIINDCLETGTQIPYIQRAKAKGYGVIVLNTNDNFLDDIPIQHSSSPFEHAQYVWDTYVARCLASSILIVAHSMGGVVTVMLANKNKEDFVRRVKAVAFTDSAHTKLSVKIENDPIVDYFKKVGKNWVTSSKPLDTPRISYENDVPRVSAGHTDHVNTSHSCMESVFKFFDEKLTKN